MFSKADIERYFIAEKHAGLLLLIVGIIALVMAGIIMLSWKTNFAKGAATMLLIAGLVQVFIGYPAYTRSDERRIDNVYSFDMNPSKLKRVELPRVQSVNSSLTIFKWAGVLLFAAGACLVVLSKQNQSKSFLFGLGLVLAIEAIIFTGYNYYAAQNAGRYTKLLTDFFQKPQ